MLDPSRPIVTRQNWALKNAIGLNRDCKLDRWMAGIKTLSPMIFALAQLG